MDIDKIDKQLEPIITTSNSRQYGMMGLSLHNDLKDRLKTYSRKINVPMAKIIRVLLINYLNQFVYTPGDINEDTLIDILDLVIVMNYILGNTDLSTLQSYASDLNEDGIINVQDIILLVNTIFNNE